MLAILRPSQINYPAGQRRSILNPVKRILNAIGFDLEIRHVEIGKVGRLALDARIRIDEQVIVSDYGAE